MTTTINPHCTGDELTFQLRDARAKYLLTAPALVEKALAGQQRSSVQAVFVV